MPLDGGGILPGGNTIVVVVRNFSDDELANAKKYELHVGSAYLVTEKRVKEIKFMHSMPEVTELVGKEGDCQYVRDLDLNLSDTELAHQFGIQTTGSAL
jgi:hypothetical protein